MKVLVLKCSKCGKEIPVGVGFYNYPSGAMCSKCGEEENITVRKAMDAEVKRLHVLLRKLL